MIDRLTGASHIYHLTFHKSAANKVYPNNERKGTQNDEIERKPLA